MVGVSVIQDFNLHEHRGHQKSGLRYSACAADRAPQSFGLSGYHLSGCSLTNVPNNQKVLLCRMGVWALESGVTN
jgi:hypothetical protein